MDGCRKRAVPWPDEIRASLFTSFPAYFYLLTFYNITSLTFIWSSCFTDSALTRPVVEFALVCSLSPLTKLGACSHGQGPCHFPFVVFPKAGTAGLLVGYHLLFLLTGSPIRKAQVDLASSCLPRAQCHAWHQGTSQWTSAEQMNNPWVKADMCEWMTGGQALEETYWAILYSKADKSKANGREK